MLTVGFGEALKVMIPYTQDELVAFSFETFFIFVAFGCLVGIIFFEVAALEFLAFEAIFPL